MVRSILIWLVFGMTLTGVATEMNPEVYGPLPLKEPRFEVAHAAHTRNVLNYQALKIFIEQNQVSSISSFLATVSEFKPTWADILRTAVLMYSSEGPFRDQISWRDPLAIIHKDTLFLEFTTSAHGTSSEKINIIEYLPNEKTFAYRQIHFASNKAQFTENPSECARCHGADSSARPIWGSHALWTGAYGGLGDRMPSLSQERIRYIHMSKQRNARMNLLEIPNFDHRSVVSNEQTHGIIFKHTPNRALNDHIHQLNFYRVLNFLREDTAYAQYRFAYAGALLDCKQVAEPNGFLPSEVFRAHESRLRRTFVKFLGDTKSDLGRQFRERALSYNKLTRMQMGFDPAQSFGETHFSPDMAAAGVITKLRFLIEGQGEPFRHLAPITKLDHPSYAFSDSRGGIRQVLGLLKQEESDIREILTQEREASCDKLAKKSRDSLRSPIGSKLKQRRPRQPNASPVLGSPSK